MKTKHRWKNIKSIKLDKKSLLKHSKKAEAATAKHAHKFIIRKITNLTNIRQYMVIWLLVVGGLIAATTIQMYWTNRSYQKLENVAGGTYAEAIAGELNTLNPIYAHTNPERAVQKLLFSQLFDYDEYGRLRNDIAKSVSVSDGDKSYTIKLRDDAIWSDGRPLTAEDIVFTVGLMKDETGELGSPMRDSWESITAKVVDKTTVQFNLRGTYAPFLDTLTFSILPSHALATVPKSKLRENIFNTSPVTSGPMKLNTLRTVSGNQPDIHKIAYMEANKSYYRGQPKLDRFELHGYSNQSEMYKAAKNHDVNALVDVPAGQLSKLPKDFTTVSVPVNGGLYLFLNNDSPILSNKQVRKALLIGSNVPELRSYLPVGTPSLSLPLIASQLSGNTKQVETKQDANQANNLLQRSGWKTKADSPVRVKAKQELKLKVVANKKAGYGELLNTLKSQWSKLGISVEVLEFDEQSGGESFAQAILQKRDYDVLLNEISFGSDPDVFPYWHSSQANPEGLNFSNYSSKVSDDILASARARRDPVLRNEKYESFIRQWHSDVPAIPVAQSTMQYSYLGKSDKLPFYSTVLPTALDRYSSILYWTVDTAFVYKTR